MNNKFNQLQSELDTELNFIEQEETNIIEKCGKAIAIIGKSMKSLKSIFLKVKGRSQSFEIDFFKNVKPKFVSKHIYYHSIYKIESNLPKGGKKEIIKYFKNELKKINQHFKDNIEFYNYYRKGNTYVDYKYFMCGEFDIKLSLQNNYIEYDEKYSTSHDYMKSEILGFGLLEVYLENRLTELSKNENQINTQHEPNWVKWTGKNIDLVELIFALHFQGVLNNGKGSLTETVSFFEKIFDIKLGQFRRTFIDIQDKKTDRTKFLSALKETLIKKLDEKDKF